MSINHSYKFYKEIEKEPALKSVFYQYNTLTGLCQYEQLFNYIASITNRDTIKVLDWGCGNGWFTYYLIKTGFNNVTSYGYGWDSIDEAKKRIPQIDYVNGADFTLSNPSKLPFKDASFDLIFSIGVLEHVHETGGDQLISLNEINRILKPNGTFFCYHLPNKLTWIEFTKGLFVKDKQKHFLHTKKFTEKEIRSLSAQTGLEVVFTKRYNILPYNIFRKNFLDTKSLASFYSFLDKMISKTPLNYFTQCYLFESKKMQ